MSRSDATLTVRIAGGLGNQLFQYAAGRALSLRNKVPLILDHVSGFPLDFYRRKFLLDHFAIKADYVDPSASYATFTGRIKRRLRIRMNQNRPLEKRSYLREPSGKFHPWMLDLPITRKIYLEGYWQHEEYFSEIRDLLLDEFTLKVPHDPANVELSKKIQTVEAVCLHVRRLHGVPNVSDAKPLPTNPAQHIDPSYYSKAVECLAQKIKNPYFFVFADYPDWARENIELPYPTEYVTHNGADKDYEDFWLMMQCRHFIVANSTFSWWTAWLARNPEKIIVVPKASLGFGLQSAPASWLLM